MAGSITSPPRSPSGAPLGKRRFGLGDRAFKGVSLTAGIGLILLLGLMLWVLSAGGSRAFSTFGIHFLTGRDWNPVFGRERFGALPFIFGTLVTSGIAVVLAVPVSAGVGVLLGEVRSGWLSNPLAVFVDLLAAIPSIVYGLWGLFIMKPVFDRHVEPLLTGTIGRVPLLGALFRGNPNGGDLFTAGVILAVMILPIITAVTREVIAIVPRDQREAAKALGATRYEMVRMAVLPYARSGIVGATMLGLGRALGETIAVSLLVGNGLGIGASLFKPGYTIPAVIVNEFSEATNVGVHRSALLALAVVLVAIALAMAALSRLLVRRTAATLGGGPAAPEAVAFPGGRAAV